MDKIRFQKRPIPSGKIIKKMGTDSDGSLLFFIGRARNFSQGKKVQYLEYQIYEKMAYKEIEKILKYALDTWGLNDYIVIHRYGRVKIGEASILISVSSPHRDESFKAVRYIIDSFKKTVPVWKKEYYTDGSVWISERS